jgi:hypothetical protein
VYYSKIGIGAIEKRDPSVFLRINIAFRGKILRGLFLGKIRVGHLDVNAPLSIFAILTYFSFKLNINPLPLIEKRCQLKYQILAPF